jgi:hypothetical protein
VKKENVKIVERQMELDIKHDIAEVLSLSLFLTQKLNRLSSGLQKKGADHGFCSLGEVQGLGRRIDVALAAIAARKESLQHFRYAVSEDAR